MGIKSRYEYLKEILLRYKYATRAQKKNILDEFCTNCGYNRKSYAGFGDSPPRAGDFGLLDPEY